MIQLQDFLNRNIKTVLLVGALLLLIVTAADGRFVETALIVTFGVVCWIMRRSFVVLVTLTLSLATVVVFTGEVHLGMLALGVQIIALISHMETRERKAAR